MFFDFLYGLNTIFSLLNINSGNRKIYEILINSSKLKSQRIREIVNIAKEKSVQIKLLDPPVFLNYLKSNIKSITTNEEIQSTQGVIAKVSFYNYSNLDFFLKNELKSKNNCVLVILDEITDVGNFGAILRNCSAFGVDGIIISKDRSVDVSSRVSKISSGAMEELKIFKVVNIVNTIEKLKKLGFWIYGTKTPKENGVISASQVKYAYPLAVIFGNEEKGIRYLTSKKCDFLITIKTAGVMKSLNVSSACAIILYIIRSNETEKSKF